MRRIIIIIGLIALSLIGSFFAGRYFERSSGRIEVTDTINSVIEKIVIKNDSILRINDSINFKVIEIERTYEKTVDDIIRNNPNDDYNFFATYIERYCGNYNTDTTEISEFNIR